MTTKEKQTEKAIIQVGTEDQKITISFSDVKRYLCPKASDAEIGLFLKVCSSEQLNPFKHECFLIKYADEQPAAIIIATETFLKTAENCPEYDGTEAGIILKNSAGELKFREGAFLLDEEEKSLVGGWAKVYRKDRTKPSYAAVNIKECMKYTRSGKPTRFWEEMPATMVRKVALSRALRESFANRFGGTLTTAEEIPEGEVPPALEKGGQPDWKKFWAKVKSELGLTTEQVRELLQVGSIKEELIDAGWTMERIWDELVNALQRQKSEARPEEVVDTQTGEILSPEEEGSSADEVKADEAWDEIQREAEVVETEAHKPQRDPASITTINELLKACNQDFKMQPRDVCKELGYKSASDINEPPSICYQKIAAMQE